MSKEELKEIFKWLEKNMNKNDLLYFKLDTQKQISGFFKSNNKRFAQFYTEEIKKHLKDDIEILDDYFKENDEWENIEEIGELKFGGDCKTRYYSKNAIGYEFPEEIADVIDQLIKNQKHLKERLMEKNEN